MIPYGRQDITQDDLDAVARVLTSDFITQGPEISGFEADFATATGAPHALTASSATAALHMAYLALGLGVGDRMWTVPNTFVATANAGLYCGAAVDFVDIDPQTYNMSVGALRTKLVDAAAQGTLPKIVTPVHFAGQSCDMAAIHALAQEYGFRIVEDASHAVGGDHESTPVGACIYSDIAVFSFHPVKIITTAEGGMATTRDPELARKMGLLRSHGITREPNEMTHAPDGPWYYQQVSLGFNYRMTDIQAVLGRSQLTRLRGYIDARHAVRERYDSALSNLPVTLPFQPAYQRSALHLYPVMVNADSPVDRATAFRELRERGVGVNVLYIPVHTQPVYRDLGFKSGDYPAAEDYYARVFVLPMYAKLTVDDQDKVITAMQSVFG